MRYLGRLLTLYMLIVAGAGESLAQNISYESYPVYTGADLGVTYTGKQTRFKVWAPLAQMVTLRLYDRGEGNLPTRTENLVKSNGGTWLLNLKGDFEGQFYTFQITQNGSLSLEVPDLYARSVGINGQRGMIVDLAACEPTGWKHDKSPLLRHAGDIVLYETHIRDITVGPASGIEHKGKFIGLAETGTRNGAGLATGLDHIKELGVTHVHLLPCFDFNSVDESKPDSAQYNWGYDPLNYNVPEGSYASQAADGKVRIREFRQLVQTLHENGLRVVMDVVYNHASDIAHSVFSQFAPGYFYRHQTDGSYSNASGCGNEVASERPMVRKFIVESVLYWAREYHIDGFRFDLMGIHDLETMRQIEQELHAFDPTIFIYGEGWAAGPSPMPDSDRALKINMGRLPRVAAFSDDIRDGLRGSFSKMDDKGFVNGNASMAESIKFGIAGSISHPQIKYARVNYSRKAWASEPGQTITYVSSHDDNTTYDRLRLGSPTASLEQLIRMDRLAIAIVLTSQGVPFMQSGAELLRSKQGVTNSYKSPDAINQIDWNTKTEHFEHFHYYKGLIALRRHHPAFSMPSAELVRQNLHFLDSPAASLIWYMLDSKASGDTWKQILVILNANEKEQSIMLPPGNWTLVSDGKTTAEAGIGSPLNGSTQIPGTSACILFNNR